MNFDQIGDDEVLEWSVSVTTQLIDNFAGAIEDFNPIHISHDAAVSSGFQTRVFHGIGLVGLISSAVANKLPGAGSVLLKLDSSFLSPAYLGDNLSLRLAVEKKYKLNSTIRFSYLICNDNSKKIALGHVLVMVPCFR
jgi:3-hydroxybutyryl-CoA dehydratase